MRPSNSLRISATVALILSAAAGCSDSADPTDLAQEPEVSEAKGGNKGGNGGSRPSDDGSSEETFGAWDDARWLKGDHPLGLGYLDPDNVSVSNGTLSLRLPAGSYDGGELQSVDRFRSGTYEASIRAADAPGSLTAFFLYEYTDSQIDEIDIEIIPDYRGGGPHVMFTTWLRSVQTNHALQALEFDPTADFHTYTIEASRKRVRFYVDGELRQQFTSEIPHARMHLMVNAWWPWWLYGSADHSDAAAAVDWIRY